MKRQWFYRGSLKSCNYSCSYCPFSKKKTSHLELERDREALSRFVCHVQNTPAIQGAIQIVPYGEALIHRHYREALATLSQLQRIDAVGAQSNLSFSVETMLQHYREHGGMTDKLRLWGTFHPEMTSIDRFVATCEQLLSHHISFCVGIVGVPGKVQLAEQLRQALPDSVYLWVNKLEGRNVKYTKEELHLLMKIDPYFELECMHHKSDLTRCADNRFVEADGTMHRCNINRHVIGNLYSEYPDIPNISHSTNYSIIPENSLSTGALNICKQKQCHCYLAYSNLELPPLTDFGNYPAFRIPNKLHEK